MPPVWTSAKKFNLTLTKSTHMKYVIDKQMDMHNAKVTKAYIVPNQTKIFIIT